MAKKLADEASERDRIEMASIDWHSFVLVETIDFAFEENDDSQKHLEILPEPMTLQEVLNMNKAEAEMTAINNDKSNNNIDLNAANTNQVANIEMSEEEREMIAQGQRAATALAKNTSNGNNIEPTMKIVRDWKRPEELLNKKDDRTVNNNSSSDYVISPITGEKILVNEMAEHMRISLIDPRWKQQREAMFSKMRETTKVNMFPNNALYYHTITVQ